MTNARLRRRLRWAGVLIAAGLIVQLVTLRGAHPLAFVAFIVIACPLIGAGVLLFLYAILAANTAARTPAGRTSVRGTGIPPG